jgi:hypothetical protein
MCHRSGSHKHRNRLLVLNLFLFLQNTDSFIVIIKDSEGVRSEEMKACYAREVHTPPDVGWKHDMLQLEKLLEIF